MIVKLLTEHNLEFLSLKGGCTGSSESTHVKMLHCWKSHVAAQIQSAKTGTIFANTQPHQSLHCQYSQSIAVDIEDLT